MQLFTSTLVCQLLFLTVTVQCINLPFIMSQWKHGSCPREGDDDTMNVCVQTCVNDFTCEHDQLCCPTPCGDGYVCVEKGSKQLIGKKPGHCPKQQGDEYDSYNIHSCESDYSCSGDNKCCLTVRGRRCMEPNYYKVPDVCPDFAGLKRSPCHIGAPSCYNQADCYKGEKCCLYPCGGICLKN